MSMLNILQNSISWGSKFFWDFLLSSVRRGYVSKVNSTLFFKVNKTWLGVSKAHLRDLFSSFSSNNDKFSMTLNSQYFLIGFFGVDNNFEISVSRSTACRSPLAVSERLIVEIDRSLFVVSSLRRDSSNFSPYQIGKCEVGDAE